MEGNLDNRRIWIIGGGVFLILILAIVLIATSCSKKNSSTGTQTLTVWNLGDDASVFKQQISDFQSAHKNVKINYVKKDSSGYLSDAIAQIAAGKGPDVWAIPNDWLPKYHEQLVAMPTGKMANSKEKKDDVGVYQETYPKVTSSDNIINNQIYGIPLSVDTLSLYINTDIFSEPFPHGIIIYSMLTDLLVGFTIRSFRGPVLS